MNQVLEVVGPNEIALAEHAAVIRALGKRVVGDVIEIGRRLTLCRDLLKEDRNWRPWLETEFRWSHQTAGRFIQVHELSQKRSNLDHLELPVSGLYLLAAPSTPDEARDAIIDRAQNGEALTHAQVKTMIDDARKQQQAEHKADRDREREVAEEKLARLREGYDKKVADLREQLARSLTPELVESAIDEAVGPLKKKIERYEKALADKKSRVPIEHAVPASAIKGALRHLAGTLTITPEQLVQSQKQITKFTRQSAREALADDIANAKAAISWLRGFVKEWESLS